jgi:nucleoside-diphosphate-sugar epimerase
VRSVLSWRLRRNPVMTFPVLEELAASFDGKRCLVTGGLGFIGSNLALTLAASGARVRVVDSLEPRHGGDVRNVEGAPIEVTVSDIGEPAIVSEVLRDTEYIFNLAGQVSHIDSMEAPLHDLDLNARSQLAFLELVRKTNPEAPIVFASTRQVYGRPNYLPVDEGHPVQPVDVNGVSKYAAERFHELYADVYGIPLTVLRLSNVYGPRQRLQGDHIGFLPVFLRRALNGEPITVYGDGSQQRDCLFVDDSLAAVLAAALAFPALGEIFNIGHDQHHGLLEIAEAIVAAAGGGEVVTVPWPPERERIAIESFWTDLGKAADLLGWKPTTSLEDGLAETVSFCRSRVAWAI